MDPVENARSDKEYGPSTDENVGSEKKNAQSVITNSSRDDGNARNDGGTALTNEENPIKDEKNVRTDETSSSGNENTRNNEKNAGNNEKDASKNKENVSCNEENVSNNEENVSINEENISNKEENASNNEESASNIVKNVSNNEENASVNVETTQINEENAGDKENASNNEKNASINVGTAQNNEENASNDGKTQRCEKYWGWNMDWETVEIEKKQQSIRQVENYREGIREYLQSVEVARSVDFNYVRKQKEITNKMRSVLVDWLIDVTEEYDMCPETLHLAVGYIDRYLSTTSVSKDALQLIGVTALMIAAKVEEHNFIDPPECAYLTRNTFSSKQVMHMEILMFQALGFNAHIATASYFIQDYCTSSNFDKDIVYLSLYISELSLVEGRIFLKYRPSLIAAASIVLARFTLYEKEACPESLGDDSFYTIEQLAGVILELVRAHQKATITSFQTVAVKKKYYKPKYECVARRAFPRITTRFPANASELIELLKNMNNTDELRSVKIPPLSEIWHRGRYVDARRKKYWIDAYSALLCDDNA